MRPFPRSSLKCFSAQRLTLYSLLAGAAICGGGCANLASIPSPPTGPQAISVTVTPSSGLVMLGNQFLFTAAVKNSSDTSVTWSVNGVAGGGAQTGTITTGGVYTAPGDLPIPANLTVTATSQADVSKSGSGIVTVQSDVSIALPSGGGTDGFTSRVDGVPEFRAGEEVYLFLWGTPGEAYRVMGWPQGTFRIVRDARTGTEKVTQESSSSNFDQRTRQFHADVHGEAIRAMALPAFRGKLRHVLERGVPAEH